jgi:hypothetical protein
MHDGSMHQKANMPGCLKDVIGMGVLYHSWPWWGHWMSQWCYPTAGRSFRPSIPYSNPRHTNWNLLKGFAGQWCLVFLLFRVSCSYTLIQWLRRICSQKEDTQWPWVMCRSSSLLSDWKIWSIGQWYHVIISLATLEQKLFLLSQKLTYQKTLAIEVQEIYPAFLNYWSLLNTQETIHPIMGAFSLFYPGW